jgi:hypothetical protein
MAQVVETLLCKLKVLSSNLSTIQKEKNEEVSWGLGVQLSGRMQAQNTQGPGLDPQHLTYKVPHHLTPTQGTQTSHL